MAENQLRVRRRALIRSNVGSEGMKFFPTDLLAVHVRLRFRTLSASIPYTFTVSSHIIVNPRRLAVLVWCTVLFLRACTRTGLKFFKIFVPSGRSDLHSCRW